MKNRQNILLAISLLLTPCVSRALTLVETEWRPSGLGTAVLPAAGTSGAFSQTGQGNPGATLEFNTSITAAPRATNVSLGVAVVQDLAYDPIASGPIDTISLSLDRFFTSSTTGQSLNTIGLLLAQNLNGMNKTYITTLSIEQTAGVWRTASATGLIATDFDELNFASLAVNEQSHPSFAQGVMFFGLNAGATFTNRGTATDTAVLELRYDNYRVDIAPLAAASPVPEPSKYLMLTAGLGLLLLRKKQKSSAAR